MSPASSLLTDVLTFLPYALAVVGFYMFLKAFYHVKTPIRPHFLWPIIFALTGTGVFMLWAHYKIIASKPAGGRTFSVSNQICIALAGYVIAWILFYLFSFAFDRLWVIYKRRRH